MLHDLADLPIISASFVTASTVGSIVVFVLLAVIARRARLRTGARSADPRRTRRALLIGAATGAVAGLALTWILGDALDLFGVILSGPTRAWTALGGLGLGLAVVTLLGSRRAVTGVGGLGPAPRRLRVLHAVVAAVTVPAVAFSAAVGINADIQEYPNIAAAFGLSRIGPLDLSSVAGPEDPAAEPASSDPVEATWKAQENLPPRGRVGSVTIPGTQSGFPARDALVYLPPAALVADAPALPVVVAMSGQPGSPLDLVDSGRMDKVLDRFAATHGGLAPIVVIPDQLGAQGANPMCVDSPLGNTDTYLTVDVPAWITAHLRVLPGRDHWAVLGFSQGGTCAAQLGSSHPDLFGTFVDISGEVAPSRGGDTVAAGFGGSQAQYAAAFPAAIMEARRPYEDSAAYFCVGENDQQYRPEVEQVQAAAQAAGMVTRMSTAPGRAHDWGAVNLCVADVTPTLAQRLGLTR
ncbi:esterase [Clavibacter tessellarius]|uniref:Esterase n=1 Tax=Clavibacter tessellarius TaxID=31965 RepID=A0A225CN43_9MICO|nr:alpha/beta hydrolase-fold protein [Clavibacter michiganensis]OQJ63806.1 esterase [Clavibacter michiganensis subsp. tessellarius]UKF33216.1 esterase [Clavibacter michiganensis subsp. tessellarius]